MFKAWFSECRRVRRPKLRPASSAGRRAAVCPAEKKAPCLVPDVGRELRLIQNRSEPVCYREAARERALADFLRLFSHGFSKYRLARSCFIMPSLSMIFLRRRNAFSTTSPRLTLTCITVSDHAPFQEPSGPALPETPSVLPKGGRNVEQPPSPCQLPIPHHQRIARTAMACITAGRAGRS